MKSLFITCLTILSLYFSLFVTPVQAQTPTDTTMEAKIVWIIEETEREVLGKRQPYQRLRMEITSGPEKGSKIEYENGALPMSFIQTYAIGDAVILGKTASADGTAQYFIMDQVRRPALYLLAGLFVLITVLVARKRAIQAILALGISFVIIFQVVLPQILKGSDPILVALVASVLIVPVTFYISHGWSEKTHMAVFGTLFALAVTAVLASVFVNVSKLTGFASEEATFLQAVKGQTVNIKGLLLAGIIIGVLGILDDVTVSQAALVRELHQANSRLSVKHLFSRTNVTSILK